MIFIVVPKKQRDESNAKKRIKKRFHTRSKGPTFPSNSSVGLENPLTCLTSKKEDRQKRIICIISFLALALAQSRVDTVVQVFYAAFALSLRPYPHIVLLGSQRFPLAD